MSTVREQLDTAVDRHCEAVGQYQEARITVAAWETYSVLSPDEVERLEYSLAQLYGVLKTQSEQLSRISAHLEFEHGEDH